MVSAVFSLAVKNLMLCRRGRGELAVACGPGERVRCSVKWLTGIFPDLTAKLRRMIRREIQRDIQTSCVTHAAARQSFDLYEMRLETMDTRVAKRILALEDRVARLEAERTATTNVVDRGARTGAARQVG